MDRKLILLTLLLTACSSPESTKEEKESKGAIVYGSSLCAWTDKGKRYPEILGIDEECKGGKQLVHVPRLDDEYDIIFLHLGLNDRHHGNRQLFREHLKHLIHGIEHKVYCIVPEWNYVHDVSWQRRIMFDECPKTIDTNITPYYEDGIHNNRENHREMAEALKPYL